MIRVKATSIVSCALLLGAMGCGPDKATYIAGGVTITIEGPRKLPDMVQTKRFGKDSSIVVVKGGTVVVSSSSPLLTVTTSAEGPLGDAVLENSRDTIDTDGDGTRDYKDICPGVPGPPPSGCPEQSILYSSPQTSSDMGEQWNVVVVTDSKQRR
jgi:hypothetical protein